MRPLPDHATLQPWHLGATLYTPGTHKDLVARFSGAQRDDARSMVVCLEDAILEKDTEVALANLQKALHAFVPNHQLRFVRPRNPEVLERVLELEGVEQLTGFVLPKINSHTFGPYRRVLDDARLDRPFWLMPTLETAETFDNVDLRALREQFRFEADRLLILRIGGNDLLNQIGMRRPKHKTLYQTPLYATICNLVQMFRPDNFHLSAPVFEYLDRMDLLEEEVEQDLLHGLTCKTAIHPTQIRVIEAKYDVHIHDLESAHAILAEDAPAVFHMHGAMNEPATHRRWAQQMLARAALYGTYGPRGAPEFANSI
jgi:citrate lyase beta subunit